MSDIVFLAIFSIVCMMVGGSRMYHFTMMSYLEKILIQVLGGIKCQQIGVCNTIWNCSLQVPDFLHDAILFEYDILVPSASVISRVHCILNIVVIQISHMPLLPQLLKCRYYHSYWEFSSSIYFWVNCLKSAVWRKVTPAYYRLTKNLG